MKRLVWIVAASSWIATAPARADVLHDADEASLSIGGYAQPQYRLRQDCEPGDPSVQCQQSFVGAFDTTDENGFSLKRTRLTIAGHQPTDLGVRVGFELEAEFTPEFQLKDAFVSAAGELPNRGLWRLDFGQVKVPISRQTLVSDAELQMVEKAQLTSLAPDRQLGVRGTVNPPFLPMIELAGSVFNGDGANQITNIDERYLWAGRLAIRPVGYTARLTEGAFARDQISVAASFGRNRQKEGSIETVLYYLGFDAFVSWNGISGTAEYLLVRTDFKEDVDPGSDRDFDANGLNVQLGYLLPVPGAMYRRFEVAGRFEEIDRNDTVPIQGPGDINQSLRTYTAGVAYYHREHNLKAQLALSHTQEVEDVNFDRNDSTYDNDTLLVQVTYRLE